MVLAIGIVVDDAIVVIENVERIMGEEHLAPKEATRKAMGQITGAIVAITVVLAAVFVPCALQPGASGHLLAVRAHHRHVHGVLGVSGAVIHSRAVRHDLRPRPEEEKKKNVAFRWFDQVFDWIGTPTSAISAAPCVMRRAGCWSSR